MGQSDELSRFFFDLGAAVLLLAVALGGAYLPRYLAQRGRGTGQERSLIFQLGNMLSAGVMLSACFCHLLASAVPEMQHTIPKFPLAHFLSALGCLLTLAADQCASHFAQRNHYHTHKGNSSLSDAIRPEYPMDQSSSKRPVMSGGIDRSESDRASLRPLEIADSADAESRDVRVSFLTALFLGLALSLHSVLEGLALGAQQTIERSLKVLIAIAAHKGLAAYALGASLTDSKTTQSRFWKVAGGFSVASPIGILVGFGFSKVSSGVGAAALSSLASGTFLYVAMMEIIPGELENNEHITSKLLVMFAGFVAMSILAIWA